MKVYIVQVIVNGSLENNFKTDTIEKAEAIKKNCQKEFPNALVVIKVERRG